MMGTEILKIDASRAELFTKNKCANLNDPNCTMRQSHGDMFVDMLTCADTCSLDNIQIDSKGKNSRK